MTNLTNFFKAKVKVIEMSIYIIKLECHCLNIVQVLNYNYKIKNCQVLDTVVPLGEGQGHRNGKDYI